MFFHLRIRYQRLRFFPNPSFRPTVESHLLMSGASVAADPGRTRTPTTGTALHGRSPASVDHRHASWCFSTLQLTVVLVLELGKQAVRNNLSMSDFQPPVPTLTPARVRRVKGQERKTPKSYDMRLSPQTEAMLSGLSGQAEKRASISRWQQKPACSQQTTLGYLAA